MTNEQQLELMLNILSSHISIFKDTIPLMLTDDPDYAVLSTKERLVYLTGMCKMIMTCAAVEQRELEHSAASLKSIINFA